MAFVLHCDISEICIRLHYIGTFHLPPKQPLSADISVNGFIIRHKSKTHLVPVVLYVLTRQNLGTSYRCSVRFFLCILSWRFPAVRVYWRLSFDTNRRSSKQQFNNETEYTVVTKTSRSNTYRLDIKTAQRR